MQQSPTDPDAFMWEVAIAIGDNTLTHNAKFQEFCLNVHDLLSVEQAAESWERQGP